jgi:pimeloyl-ACP methyl ester carboxylesterase
VTGAGGRWRRRATRAAACAALALAACAGDGGGGGDDGGDGGGARRRTAGPDFTSPAEGTFTEAQCDPAPAPADAHRVTCGFLEVPEHHAEPGGPTVRIAVAVVEPEGEPAGPEPVVHLAGGPGFGSVGALPQVLEDPPVERTIVLVDYRGVGRSEPSLDCPENDAPELLDLTVPAGDPAARARRLDAVRACRARLAGSGVDVAAYGYDEIAADLDSLRAALGYEQWDLWGLSNGGRVALEVARRYPEGVRALVLDAPGAPQGNLPGELWSYAALAFDRLFDACAADDACDAAYPDLAGTWERLVRDLARSPELVRSSGSEGVPPTDVRFDDVLALDALRQALYETPLIPLLPYYLHEVANGRQRSVVAQLVAERSGPSMGYSDGMGLTVSCREEIAFLPVDHFDDQAEDLPLFAPAIRTEEWAETCKVWDAGRADDVIDEAVESDVPALILVGELDPVHPREAAESIAEGLPNATVVVVPGIGHGTIWTGPCPHALMAAFLAAPGEPVDTGCVDDLPPIRWLGAGG